MFLAARAVMETEETGAIESDTLKESAGDIDSSLGLEGRRLQIPGGLTIIMIHWLRGSALRQALFADIFPICACNECSIL